MKLFLALALSLAALSAPPVQAQTTVGEAARAIGAANDLVAAMKGERPYAETFAPVFVTALPEAQFRALVEQLEAQYGPLQALGDNLSTSSATAPRRFPPSWANCRGRRVRS